MLNEILHKRLERLHHSGAFRALRPGSPSLDFSSNDYLGLARSKELTEEIEKSGGYSLPNGATGSRLLTGNHEPVRNVEEYLAEIFQCEATLVFNSGYAANTSVLSSLPGKGDTILYDELSHASIKDGARLSLAGRFAFRHNDLEDLDRKLTRSQGNKFVVAESIYSMDGDLAPVRQLADLARRHQAFLILDEAHSTGIYGQGGCGLSVSENIHREIPVRVYTFGKAMGVHGACVAGSRVLIDYLINTARPFVYTTAIAPHSALAIGCAFRFLHRQPRLQEALWGIIDHYRQKIPSARHRSPIQPVVIPGNREVRQASQALLREGFDIRAIVAPTVKTGTERLRITLHAFNSKDEVDRLAGLLNKFIT